MEEVSFSILENVSRFFRLEIAVRKSLVFRMGGLLSRPVRQVLKTLALAGSDLPFEEVYRLTAKYDQDFIGEVLELAGLLGILTFEDETVVFDATFLVELYAWDERDNAAVTRWVSNK